MKDVIKNIFWDEKRPSYHMVSQVLPLKEMDKEFLSKVLSVPYIIFNVVLLVELII